MGMLRIRPSTILKHDECPRAVYFAQVEGLERDVVSANLPFGTSVHEAATGYILSTVSGKPFNPVDAFQEKWEAEISRKAVEFSSIWDEESMAATGRMLAERFPPYWDSLGLQPLIDEDGPVVERRFEVQIDKDIILSGQPDVVAVDEDLRIYVPDVKTTAAPYDASFALVSEQLTAYDILLTAHKDSLGIEKVDQLGYLEGVKRKVPKTSRGKGPDWEPPLKGPARTDEHKREYIDKVKHTVAEIRSGRFPRRPRMAFNSPCQMCDFAGLCLQGSMEGLRKVDRKSAKRETANAA